MAEDFDDDEKYLEFVLRELERREGVLKEYDRAIEALEETLRNAKSGRGITSGNAGLAKSEAMYRSEVARQIKEKKLERDEAENEVNMARDRKIMVEEDLRVKKT